MAKRKNYHAVRYGTEHGEIKFGHLHDDDNISGVMLRTGEDAGRHYMTMDSSGDVLMGRKGSTMNVCPGQFSIKAGKDLDEGGIPGIYQVSENGDIVIGAPKGKVRIYAENIELFASGSDGEYGVVQIDANSQILLNAQTVEVKSTVSSKFFSEKTVEVIGESILNLYGGLVDMADGATKIKGSKTCGGPASVNEGQHK